MAAHFQTLLEGIIADSDRPISTLPLLTGVERQRLLVEWNNTEAEYPRELCLHHLFETQAKRTPGAVAVTFKDKHLTYDELNRRANQLAHHLRKLGVEPETLVGLCVDRSLEMVVALLGVLKAGGAYLPLDLTYPQERLAFMTEDSQASVKPITVTSQCVVIAESEMISLVNEGNDARDIFAGVVRFAASRIGSIARKIRIRKEVAFVGGVAKNHPIRDHLEESLGMSFDCLGGLDPQMVSAYGAALLAKEQSLSIHKDQWKER